MNRDKLKFWLICSAVVLLLAIIGTALALDGFEKNTLDHNDDTASSESIVAGKDDVDANGITGSNQEDNASGESNGREDNSGTGVSDTADSTVGTTPPQTGTQSGNPSEDKDESIPSEEDKTDSSTGDKDTGNQNNDQSNGKDDNKEEENSSESDQGSADLGKGDDSSDSQPDEEKKPYIPESLTYEEYIALSAQQQQAYFKSFENYEDYFTWYTKAKAEYEKENSAIEIGGGSVDIGDIINGK